MTRLGARFGVALAAAMIALPAFGVAAVLGVDVIVDITFDLGGLGSGRVQSLDADFEPDGIFDCERLNGQPGDPSHCHATIGIPTTDPFLRIRITPGVGSLACWEGVCAPDIRQLLVPISGDSLIAVRFDRMPFDLTVHKAGSGTGLIFGTEGDINCGKVCTVTLEYGHQMLLSAIADTGSKFDSWTGACAGQPQDCLISLIADTDTTARFVLQSGSASNPPGPTPRPTVQVDPSGGPGPSVAPSVATSSPGASGSPGASAGSATGAPTPSPGPTPVSTTGGGEPSLLVLVLGGGGAALLAGLLVYRLLSSRRGSTAPDET